MTATSESSQLSAATRMMRMRSRWLRWLALLTAIGSLVMLVMAMITDAHVRVPLVVRWGIVIAVTIVMHAASRWRTASGTRLGGGVYVLLQLVWVFQGGSASKSGMSLTLVYAMHLLVPIITGGILLGSAWLLVIVPAVAVTMIVLVSHAEQMPWNPVLLSVAVSTLFIGMLIGLLLRIYERTLQDRYVAQATFEDRLRARTDTLTTALRAKDALLTTTSHELRTPLNAILGLAELNRDALAHPERLSFDQQRQNLDRIVWNADHLRCLINDILDLANIRAGAPLPLKHMPVPLTHLLTVVVSATSGLAEAKGLTMRFMPGMADAVVYGDSRRIRQVVINVLNNAVKFTPSGGITISYTVDHEYATIAVADTGIGIAPDQHRTVFLPFSQITPVHDDSREAGTGLGLAIADCLVALHGGSMWLDSTPGIGTTVFFTLPLMHRIQLPALVDAPTVITSVSPHRERGPVVL